MSEMREGTTTILFTDVEGSTDLGTRAGDDSARRVLKAQEDVVAAEVGRFGGRVVKSLGDGLMIAFPSARKAVACAAAVQRELRHVAAASPETFPRVRMGLNAGDVVEEDGDLFGSAVSAAARICEAARGGEILASEVVKALAGAVADVSWEERGETTLRGFAEPCKLFAAQWRGATSAIPAGVTPFVGRAQERAELRSLLDDLERGRGGLVAIGGEPGVGKTRLAEEVMAEGRARGFRTLTGRCYEIDSPTPYGPFVEVLEAALQEVDPATFRAALGPAAGEIAKVLPQLRHLYDDIPPPLELPPQQERRYLFNSIREFIERASAQRPLVVLFDDVHWTDDASLQLMEYLAPEVQRMPVLVLATYRDVELDVHRPLARTMEDLLRRRLGRRVSLTRLPEDAVAEMLGRLAGSDPPPPLTRTIYRETDGNPFFVEEVFRHLDEEGRLRDDEGRWRADLDVDDLEVPESVRLVVGRRLQRLGDAATKVLTAGAVIGRVFDFRLLQAVARVEGEELLDCLDAAERARVVSSRADGRDAKVAFVHELIRHTLLAGVALPRRQRLHLEVAEAMEKIYADDLSAHAAEIAHHLYRAGAAADPAKTEHYLVMAGHRAMEGAAFAEALKYFEDALDLGAVRSDSERASLLYEVGRAQRSLGRLDEGIATWRQALALYEAAGDRAAIGEVTPEIGLQLTWAARWPEAVEIAARGLAAIGEDQTVDRIRLQGLAAVGLGWAGDHDRATAMIEPAVAATRDLGDDVLLGEGLAVLSAHHFAYYRPRLAVEAGEQAIELLEGTVRAWTHASIVGFTALAHYFVGDLERALERAEDALALSRRLGHLPAQLFGDRAKFCVHSARGELTPDEWEAFAHRDGDLCRAAELPFDAYSTCFLAEAEWKRGRAAAACELLEQAAAAEPPSAMWGFTHGLRFLVYADVGRRDRAEALIPDLEALLPQPGRANASGIWSVLLFFVEGCSILRADVDYGRLHDLVCELLEGGAVVRWEGMSIQVLAALAAAGAGRPEAAVEHFERGLAQADQVGLVRSHADGSRRYAEFLLRRGSPGDAARAGELLARAGEMYGRVGFVVDAARVRDLQAAVGAQT